MPSTRRTFLSTLAVTPLGGLVMAGESTEAPAVDWTTELDTGVFIDSARRDGETLVLSESPAEYGIVTTVDDDGTATEFTRIERKRNWEAVAAREDRSMVAAGFSSGNELTLHRVGPDGALECQHAVSVGEYDAENRVHPLADGRVAVVSHFDTPQTPASLRVHILGPDGEIHREWPRDGSYGRATVTGDGELLIGGRFSRDDAGAWMARFGTSGEKRWEKTWHDTEYVYDDIAFDASGGIYFGGRGVQGRKLARDVAADGTVGAEWEFHLDERPKAARRAADGSAVLVTNSYDSPQPRFHQTFPDGTVESYDLQLFRTDTEIHDLYPTTSGYVLTGQAEPGYGEPGRAVHLAHGDGSMETTETPSNPHTGDPAESLTNQTTTGPATSATQVSTRTRANVTDTESATGASGSGFGILTASVAAIAASLARYRTAEAAD